MKSAPGGICRPLPPKHRQGKAGQLELREFHLFPFREHGEQAKEDADQRHVDCALPLILRGLLLILAIDVHTAPLLSVRVHRTL